jgi:hypothetical protein
MVAQVNWWFLVVPPPALMALSRGISGLTFGWTSFLSRSRQVGQVVQQNNVMYYMPGTLITHDSNTNTSPSRHFSNTDTSPIQASLQYRHFSNVDTSLIQTSLQYGHFSNVDTSLLQASLQYRHFSLECRYLSNTDTSLM